MVKSEPRGCFIKGKKNRCRISVGALCLFNKHLCFCLWDGVVCSERLGILIPHLILGDWLQLGHMANSFG